MRLDLVKIRRVDVENRVADGESLSTGVQYVNILLTSPANMALLPQVFDEKGMENLGEGQIALVLFDDNERPFCIGFLEVNFAEKIKRFLERKIQPGEVLLKGTGGQELYFNRHGDFGLQRIPDGMNYDGDERKFKFLSNLFNFVAGGVEIVFGFVRRGLMGLLDELGNLAQEFVLRVKRKTAPGVEFNLVELMFGNLFDELGIPILGLRSTARVLFRVFNDAGLSVAEMSVDSLGNIKFKFNEVSGEFLFNAVIDGLKMDLKVLELNIGKTGKLEKVILGETFYNLFKNHVHSTPLGPSSPPTVILPDAAVLSNTTKTT